MAPSEKKTADQNVVPPPTVTFATGWSEINIISGGAKIDITTAGHYAISRNACAIGDYGAIGIDDWNLLAQFTNAALAAAILPEEKCFLSPYVSRGLDGSVDIKLTSGKRSLLTARGGEQCSTISDQDTAKGLVDVLNRIVAKSFVESCPD